MVGLSDNTVVDDLKRKVTKSIEKHFKLRKGLHVASWDVKFSRLDRAETESLKVPFSEEEVHKELMGADGG